MNSKYKLFSLEIFKISTSFVRIQTEERLNFKPNKTYYSRTT